MLRRVPVLCVVVSAVAGLGCDDDVVQLPGGISGRVCDVTTRQGLGGIAVEARGPETARVPTGGNGDYAINLLDAGDYNIFAIFADGTERQVNPVNDPVEVIPGNVTLTDDSACGDLPIDPKTGSIEGQICNRHTGALVQEATVSVIAADDTVLGETTTDSEGRFLIEDVLQGDHTIAISAPDFRRAFPVTVNIDETFVLDLNEGTCGVPFGTGCTILGSLCDPDGEDGDKLAGATVRVSRDGADPSEAVSDISDTAGEFYVSALLPGTYTVSITSTNPPVNEQFFDQECIAGQETVIVGPDECADRTPIGRLQGQLCDLVAFDGYYEGPVFLLQGGTVRYSTETDDEGRFGFDVVTPGVYDLHLGSPAARIYPGVVINNFQTAFVEEPTCPELADECENYAHEPDVTSDGRILFVVDRSGSMQQAASDFGNLSKWDALRNTLETVTSSLASNIEYGLFIYPDDAQDSATPANCSAGVQKLAVGGTAADVNSALDGIDPGGGTPTQSTLDAVVPVVRGLVGDDRPIAVVLATDGAPNCLQNDPVLIGCTCTSNAQEQSNASCASFNCLDTSISTNVGPLAEIAALGVQTHVVGIPDVSGTVNQQTAAVFTSALNAMAVAGGAPLPGAVRFHDGSNTGALQSALQAITKRILSCQVTVRDDGNTLVVLDGFTSLDVRLGDASLPRDTARRNGWDIVGPSSIELFGSACDAATGSPLQVSVRRCARP